MKKREEHAGLALTRLDCVQCYPSLHVDCSCSALCAEHRAATRELASA